MSVTVEYSAETVQAIADSANDMAAWRAQGLTLASEDNHRQWAIGDWLLAGEERWQKKAYKEAAAIFPTYKHSTLKDFAYVTRNVPASVRTDALQFGYHKLVARFPKPEYQQELLAFASEKLLKLDAFRKYINSKHPPVKKAAKPKPLQITLPPEVLASVKLFAKANQESVEKTVAYLVGRALETSDIKREIECLTVAAESAPALTVAEYNEAHAEEAEEVAA